MEDKVLVRVRASMSGLAFDFKIPYDIQVKDITPTMKQMFCKVSEQKLPFCSGRCCSRWTARCWRKAKPSANCRLPAAIC